MVIFLTDKLKLYFCAFLFVLGIFVGTINENSIGNTESAIEEKLEDVDGEDVIVNEQENITITPYNSVYNVSVKETLISKGFKILNNIYVLVFTFFYGILVAIISYIVGLDN